MKIGDTAIEVDSLKKTFKLPKAKSGSVKSEFINIFREGRSYETQSALNNISFKVKTGEFFGIVGRNGSGKSTLLKLLAGIYTPTEGRINVNGRLTPFIELGVGFNPELTGRENVFLNGSLLGFNREEMYQMYQDIVKFAELEKFMEQKLKNYSSGMQVRLAFSIAIRAESDILLIDEVLAVGDASFQRKCFDYFKEIKRTGRTVIFVSHDMDAVKEFCDQAILIDDGELLSRGTSAQIAEKYTQLSFQAMGQPSIKARWGSGEMKIVKYSLINSNKGVFKPSDSIRVKIQAKSYKAIKNPIFGIIVRDLSGRELFSTNSKVKSIESGDGKKGTIYEVDFEIDNVFNDGTYLVTPGIASFDTRTIFDWIENAMRLEVRGWAFPAATIQAKHTIKVTKK